MSPDATAPAAVSADRALRPAAISGDRAVPPAAVSADRAVPPAAFRPAALPTAATSARERDGAARGYTAGYAAGWAAGSRAAAQAGAVDQRRRDEEAATAAARQAALVETAVAALAQSAAAARARTAPVVEEALATLARGAVELAEAVLGVELADDDTSARVALIRALALAGDVDLVRIRMNPGDLAHLRSALERHPTGLDLPPGVDLVADDTLGRGEAVSELAEGYLDARIGSAVTRARQALGVCQ
ncbi:MAG: FliH/SctL family protein [Georgenia sp.]